MQAEEVLREALAHLCKTLARARRIRALPRREGEQRGARLPQVRDGGGRRARVREVDEDGGAAQARPRRRGLVRQRGGEQPRRGVQVPLGELAAVAQRSGLCLVLDPACGESRDRGDNRVTYPPYMPRKCRGAAARGPERSR